MNEALSTEVSNRIENQERYLCAAKLRMEQDMPHYSDANFTMRLSYGQVGGFMLGGKPSGYYTTAESIIDKMDRSAQQPDWKAEPKHHRQDGPLGPTTRLEGRAYHATASQL